MHLDDPKPRSIWRNPIHFLAFGFGSGILPYAPGTWGTLAAIPFYYILINLSLPYYLVTVIAAAIVGVWLCGTTARDLGYPDHPGIVWDEMVGFWITMIAAPKGPIWVALGFLLFRLFDVWKPWPICWLDKNVPGGLGVMSDDILAGIFAMIIMQIAAISY